MPGTQNTYSWMLHRTQPGGPTQNNTAAAMAARRLTSLPATIRSSTVATRRKMMLVTRKTATCKPKTRTTGPSIQVLSAPP